jgi:hypothetical protein
MPGVKVELSQACRMSAHANKDEIEARKEHGRVSHFGGRGVGRDSAPALGPAAQVHRNPLLMLARVAVGEVFVSRCRWGLATLY